MNVGIHGLGIHLPKTIRTNDWWPQSTVEKWRQKATAAVMRGLQSPDEITTEGQRRTLEAMAALRDDPFLGCRERRVIDQGQGSADVELLAARDALADAQVEAKEIGLLLTYSTTPRYALAPEFGLLHRELGLPRNCISTSVDAVCNAFAMQLTLAAQMVASGRVRYALLVQASIHSRLATDDDLTSALVGDAATALVIGPAADGYGVLGYAHGTDGDFHRGLVCSVPGGTWYDEGRVMPWSPDARVGRRMVLSLADWSKQIVEDALADARVDRKEVAFYASHQPTRWLRELTRDHLGLDNARGIDTFPWMANVMCCNVPLQLALGTREGLLRDGDCVATFSGGAGVTWSGIVIRWGGCA